jgi:predicted MPP superfamily phosphohydrolase
MEHEPSERHLPRLTRRQFLALSAGSLALGVGGYAWGIEPHWVQVNRRTLPIAGLPPALVGRTLVQLSDLHVGPVVSSDYLIASLKLVSSLAPDLIVITGDFMTCEGMEQIDAAVRVMEHLQPGPLGCLAVVGNHEYTLNWSRTEVADRLVRRLTDLGIRVLRNECQVVAGLQVVGLDDLWGPRFRPQDVLPKLDAATPVLTLCHNPDAVDLPAMARLRGWVLSGHTHGGQLRPPFLPPPVLPVKNRRYTAGEFALGNGRWLYINRGLGYLRRVRFNVRPEITLFQMQRA